MSIKEQLLNHPDVAYVANRYTEVGKNFHTNLDAAIDKYVPEGTTKVSWQIVEQVVWFLNAQLEKKPATTKGGKIIRGLLKLISILLPMKDKLKR